MLIFTAVLERTEYIVLFRQAKFKRVDNNIKIRCNIQEINLTEYESNGTYH